MCVYVYMRQELSFHSWVPGTEKYVYKTKQAQKHLHFLLELLFYLPGAVF